MRILKHLIGSIKLRLLLYKAMRSHVSSKSIIQRYRYLYQHEYDNRTIKSLTQNGLLSRNANLATQHVS